MYQGKKKFRSSSVLTSILFLCGISFLGVITDLKSKMLPTVGLLAATADASKLEKILTDRRLWGDDALAVFASLDRWKNVGEISIILYPDKVAGGSKSDTSDKAKESVARMAAAMKGARPKLGPAYTAPYREALATKVPALKVNFARFLEDDSFRVVWQREGGEFLKRDLKMRAVFDAYGKPEKTTTEVVHSRGDRRPAVLTLHHYANDTIKFVESDLAPMPGLVDRAILDVPAASAHIFGGPR